jgi:hypothetical protein
MPTFTRIALQNLHEPQFSTSSNLKHQTSEFVDVTDVETQQPNPTSLSRGRVYIPALYTTPEPTPVSGSSVDSLTPSPYVFNRKGRGGKGSSRVDDDRKTKAGENGDNGETRVEQGVYDDFSADVDGVLDEDFWDPGCETLSAGSSSGRFNGFRREVENFSAASNQGEFFDADEELFSDSSDSNAPSCAQSIECVLRTTRVSLLEEIGKRKISEEALDQMYNQWQRIFDVISRAGLTLSSPPNGRNSMQIDLNSIEQFIQEVIVAKYVNEAIENGQARAEAESDAYKIIQSKDREISRLKDRLQYYEAVNHEMSQRNQEVMEIARKERQRKKSRQQRWLWGCIGLSIAAGATVIATYSCKGQCQLSFQTWTNSADTSSVISSDSA